MRTSSPRGRTLPLLATLLFTTLLLAACRQGGPFQETIDGLQAQALESELAWTLLESLTTDVGPRMAGTRGDAMAVAWAQERFEELGFDRVRLEPVTFPLWQRGYERARIVAPRVQELAVTALLWLLMIVLFYSGAQKLVYGYYFGGEFLAYVTATEDRFAFFFRHVNGNFIKQT